MKIIINKFVILSILISLLLAVGLSAFILGDMNDDNEINNKDVVSLFRYVSNNVKSDNESTLPFTK